MDIFFKNGGCNFSFGNEVLVAGSQSEFQEHAERAELYAHTHGCIVLYMNISMSNKAAGRTLTLPKATNKVRFWTQQRKISLKATKSLMRLD